MDMDKLSLDDATDEQIRTFARVFLQLEGADAKAIKAVRADVTAAWPQNFIWLAKAPVALQVVGGTDIKPGPTKEEIEAKAGPGIAPTSSKGDPIVELTIHKQDYPGGKDPVFLNVNGMAIHIARAKVQRVPWRYFQDLESMIQRIHNWDEKTSVVSHEDVNRFPMSIHKMPSDDEIFAFDLADAARHGQTLNRDQWESVRASREAAKVEAARQHDAEQRAAAG